MGPHHGGGEHMRMLRLRGHGRGEHAQAALAGPRHAASAASACWRYPSHSLFRCILCLFRCILFLFRYIIFLFRCILFFFATFFFMARHGTLPQLPQLPWSAPPPHAERLAVAPKHSVRRAEPARQRKVGSARPRQPRWARRVARVGA